jgi:cytochrome P450
LIKNPEYGDQMLQELKDVIFLPSLGLIKRPMKLIDLLDYENIPNLEFIGNCYNESMRMQPPVYYTSPIAMSQSVVANGLKIRAYETIIIDNYRLHNNADEWQQPSLFRPERFDPTSDLSKTPCGKKRNPFSFAPFLGGKRVCLGKSFVEMISKLTLPVLW